LNVNLINIESYYCSEFVCLALNFIFEVFVKIILEILFKIVKWLDEDSKLKKQSTKIAAF